MAVFLVILLYTTTQLGFHSFVDGSVAEVASLGFGRGKIWCPNHARNFAFSGARTLPEILRMGVGTCKSLQNA